jgi:hypothetical protein
VHEGASFEEPETLGEIGRLIAAEIAAQEVGDLAFFARQELRSCLDALTRAAAERKQLIVASHCESSIRRLSRALHSVESAVHEFEGMEPPERPHKDLEISLRIRRLYANLRRAIAGHGEERRTPIRLRMRTVLFHMVALRELNIYPFLRFDDRVQLRELLRRMLSWLNNEARSDVEGRLIWDDLNAFSALIAEVRHREELKEHDRQLVGSVWCSLFEHRSPPPEVPPAIRSELEELLGLDEEVDRLILGGGWRSTEQWRAPLERLRASLFLL